MHNQVEEQWIVAEEADDGTQWPLLFVATRSEAVDIVRALRVRGRNVVVVAANTN